MALVGASYHDVKEVMIEGESGLLAISPKNERPEWISSRRLLRWNNGVEGHVFTANDPDGLRGSQFGVAWCDEIVKWFYASETWDMLQFCLRLGARPRSLITTTPKPTTLIKELVASPLTRVTHATTADNAANLAPGFIERVKALYGDTRLGRQELGGELIEDCEGGLWKRSQLEQIRRPHPGDFVRLVVAIDPPVTGNTNSDSCGIVAAGRTSAGELYVLADATLETASPVTWAKKAVDLFHSLEADYILAEVNQGGELVKTVIQHIDGQVPVRSVHASRGKWIRAEPVALLYEQGRVFHAGAFSELEDEMCAFVRNGQSSGNANGHSPDRVDALVWALTELGVKTAPTPRARRL